ncbi:MAG: choice-of-anchor D domain-containing protein [Ilumatobacteraceae bacterium]
MRARLGVLAVAVAGLATVAVADRPDPVEAQNPFVPAELASYEPSGSPLFTDAAEPGDQRTRQRRLVRVRAEQHEQSADSGADRPVRRRPRPERRHESRTERQRMRDRVPARRSCSASSRLAPWSASTGVAAVPRGSASTTPPAASAAVDADGSVIAFPGQGGIDVFTMSGTTVVGTASIPAPVQGWTVSEAAISDNGATMAVIAGPDSNNDGFLESSSLYILDVASRGYQGIATTANGVSMSGDGTLVAYRNYRERPDHRARSQRNQNRPVAAASGAFISNDGRYLAIRLFAGDNSYAFVTRSSDRWVSANTAELMSYTLPGINSFVTAAEPVISEYGRWVGWISPNPYLYVDQPPSIGRFQQRQALVRERRPVLSVQPIDYGTVPGPTDRTSVVTNTGPSGWVVTSIETTGPFQVRSESCPDVLHPGQSCEVVVRYLAQTAGAANGELLVRDNSYPGVPLVASGRLVGSFQPGVVVTTTTIPPGSGVVTTTTTLASSGLSITPNPVIFDDAVVGQAAPTREATVTNTGGVSVTVQSVGIAGVATADYAVVDDGCTDETLAPGATCALELQFRPTAAGGRSATVSVTGSSSTFASAGLRGTGRYDAVLEVLPESRQGARSSRSRGRATPRRRLSR